MTVRFALLVLLLAVAAHGGEPDRVLLAAQGIGRDAEALGAYLRSLQPDERERAVADEAVRALGADDPVTRHEAMLTLSTLRAPPLLAIRRAQSSDDTEVRRVATRLLEESLRKIRKDVLLAVLRTIADEDVKGLANEVLGVAPLATVLRLDAALAGSLRTTLEADDITALRLAAGAGDIGTRTAAVRALGAAPHAGEEEVVPYLDAKEEAMRLAAALALADRGDRRCLPVLLALLEAKDTQVRRGASDALRATCGGGVGYDPFGTQEGRRDAIVLWKKRVEAMPQDADWAHPLPVGIRQLGRTLISIFSQKRVVEVDADGSRTFEVSGLEGPWAILGLPSGHRLIALHTRQEILEYDAEGREISRMRVPGRPGGFRRLDNGNTLVALSDQDRIVEMKPDGTIADEIGVRGYPVDVQVLDNGNLLVLLVRPNPQAVEIDRKGRVCWSLGGFSHATTAQRLENGNTLIAETGGQGRAVEFDAMGRVVWERAGLRQCYSAERLPDGSTLVADAEGVREIGPDGSERWLYKATSFARASRY